VENKNLESEIIKLENRYWNAIKDNDVETMMKLSDENCIVTGAQGVTKVKRSDFPKMNAEGNKIYTLNDFKLKDHKITIVNEDIVVVGYNVWENLTVEGKPIELEAADASTWIRKDGKWVCVLHTESLVGDPFGRH
tara:strand:+ start:13097 stop:13504 length:408 start_codon:yes stop_codon:yes gene_type:complete